MKKIALEEHFWVEGFPHTARVAKGMFLPTFAEALERGLPDFDTHRLAAMDEAGIAIAVLSLVAPGVQTEPDTRKAIDGARRANDALAAEVSKRPDRFAGFAHLAMQDPKAAADELERAVRELGFKGALINDHTNGEYLDDEKYLPFWERAAGLDVPVYLHPANMPAPLPPVLQGYPALGASLWGWTAETGGHALRLVFSGLFDRLPGLKIVLGHLGEGLPYYLWRIDSRFGVRPPKIALKEPPSHYIKQNFWVTTTGCCQDELLLCAMAAMGPDRVMFSVDYPFEHCDTAARFIEGAPISETDREKVCWSNAAGLLGLG